MLQDVRGLEVIKTPMMEQKQKKQLVGAKLIFKRNDLPQFANHAHGFLSWAFKKYLKYYCKAVWVDFHHDVSFNSCALFVFLA